MRTARGAMPATGSTSTNGETSVDAIKAFLDGKKTYLVALAIAAVVAARRLEWVDEGTYQTLLGVLGAGGLVTLRAGVAKSAA